MAGKISIQKKAIQACLDFLKANPDYDLDIIFAVLDDNILKLGEKTLTELRTEDCSPC